MSKRVRATVMIILLMLGLGGSFVQWIIPPPQVLLPLPPPTADGGYGWSVSLPKSKSFLSLGQQALYTVYRGDNSSSHVILIEDGRPLPRPGCIHQDIRDLGAGRYSHSGNGLWFSTLQNDDPTTNGRIYEIEIRVQPRIWILAAIALICSAMVLVNDYKAITKENII
ncbi:MAG: hypothetical protein FWG17_01500 [Desulfovibrionaceae bacterium]|nr:hypothetical protein [Desulfovibrionaceae bacterium]